MSTIYIYVPDMLINVAVDASSPSSYAEVLCKVTNHDVVTPSSRRVYDETSTQALSRPRETLLEHLL